MVRVTNDNSALELWKNSLTRRTFFKGPLHEKDEEIKRRIYSYELETRTEISNTWTDTTVDDRKKLEPHYKRFKDHVQPKLNPIFARFKFTFKEHNQSNNLLHSFVY